MVSRRSRGGRGVGNSRPPTPRTRRRARRWLFTLNNWSHSEWSALLSIGHLDETVEYVFGKEGAVSPATPHIQGFIAWKNQRSFSEVRKISPRAHWLQAKGSKTSNRLYCRKEGNFVDTFKEPLPLTKIERCLQEYANVNWKAWQKSVIALSITSRTSRTIHWYWEPIGNVGKSWLVRYLFLTNRACLALGKRCDILHSIVGYMEREKGKEPEIILIDVPRKLIRFVSYHTIESIKDRLFQSGKYESKDVLLEKHPHVFCFANYPPEMEALSLDRWHIVEIEQ